MVQKIDHVVIAVNDLNEGMAQYEKTLGVKPSRTGERPSDGFKSAFYDLPGGGFLELIQPTDATGPVAKGLAARGEGVYLVALAVEDIEAEVAGMRARGIRLIGDPGPGKPITGVVFANELLDALPTHVAVMADSGLREVFVDVRPDGDPPQFVERLDEPSTPRIAQYLARAGAEMRVALGTAVFWGMIGVTLFGLLFTPVFYVVIRGLVARFRGPEAPAAGAHHPTPAE